MDRVLTLGYTRRINIHARVTVFALSSEQTEDYLSLLHNLNALRLGRELKKKRELLRRNENRAK